jgi:polyisoprenoid-binding protein YceI
MTQTAAETHSLPTAGNWQVGQIEAFHSSVDFKVIHHAVTMFRSGFSEFSASFEAEARKFTGSVNVESVQCFELLRSELLSEQFFDAEKHPEFSFESSSIDESEDRLLIDGDLTMKGITKRVSATGTVLGTAPVFDHMTKTTHEHFGIELQLTVNRQDFGISFNNQLPNGLNNLGDEVTIELAFDFARVEPIEPAP